MNKPDSKPLRTRGDRGRISVSCPVCGSPSRVFRSTRGERLYTSQRDRDFVLRERRCVSPAHHRFKTEEHAR